MPLLKAHLEAHVPWGAKLDIHLDDKGPGFAADADGPVYDQARAAFADAWGVEPVDIGVGGSIPFVAAVRREVPRRRASSSPAWRTPTRERTAPTSRCTSASSRRCVWPRPCSSPALARSRATDRTWGVSRIVF